MSRCLHWTESVPSLLQSFLLAALLLALPAIESFFLFQGSALILGEPLNRPMAEQPPSVVGERQLRAEAKVGDVSDTGSAGKDSLPMCLSTVLCSMDGFVSDPMRTGLLNRYDYRSPLDLRLS